MNPPSPPRPPIIGLTGPIGCGKSTVAGWLAERGGRVIDADDLARRATRPGAAALEPIARRFGAGLIDAAGRLDRAALAVIVFDDPRALADLEAIVHPAVRVLLQGELERAADQAVPFVVLEAIKLIEGGLAELCQEVWLVTCRPASQRARLGRRGLAGADTRRRMAAQGDLVARLRPLATREIATDGSLQATRQTVLAALDLALRAPRRGWNVRSETTDPG